ncbi:MULTISPECIES: general stress protein [Paenibacillus]|uniref:general stress protein n=1 Tax=Paenibacillus TaxID=44249 RepID=UPI000491165F|nr:general stress protein [Paenibacillus sp. IHBB 10380]
MERKVAGVFRSEQEAAQAIERLQRNGIPSDAISIITKDQRDADQLAEQTGTMAPEGVAAGAATGGILGGTAGLLAGLGALAIPGIGPILAAGPIAAVLTGAAVGAGTGGLVGGFIGLGIPEEEAREYESYVEEGRILVLVDADQENTGIYDIFRDSDAMNADRYGQAGPEGEAYLPPRGTNL